MPGVRPGGTIGRVIHRLDFAEPGLLSDITTSAVTFPLSLLLTLTTS